MAALRLAAVALAATLVVTPLPSRAPAGGDEAPFDRRHSGVDLRIRTVRVPYDVFATFALPGERVELTLPRDAAAWSVVADAGTTTAAERGRWHWVAPDRPGSRTRVRVVDADGRDRVTVNAFVLVPASAVRDGRLEGYRIGSYPETPLRGLEVYRPPAGFVRVTPDDWAVPVSPHFTLGQFRCKQDDGPPEFIVLREQLLAKLEYLLGVVNDAGFRTESFHVMSGFRTPHYNAAIGNRRYSRHVWGGAADVFIDVAPRDGLMDDLDGDGDSDKDDAAVLYRLFDRLADRPEYHEHVGGLGEYGPTPAHGPFVHVDARGFKARWGH